MITYKQTEPNVIQTSGIDEQGNYSTGLLRKVGTDWFKGDDLIDVTGLTVEWLDEVVWQTEQDAEQALLAFKTSRQSLLDNAVVIANGFSFDADEVSMGRMTNAILALSTQLDTYILAWSLADTATGVMTNITLADLKLAHSNAVQNMSNIWSI